MVESREQLMGLCSKFIPLLDGDICVDSSLEEMRAGALPRRPATLPEIYLMLLDLMLSERVRLKGQTIDEMCAHDDPYMDVMDVVWYMMTEAEMAEANKLLLEFNW